MLFTASTGGVHLAWRGGVTVKVIRAFRLSDKHSTALLYRPFHKM